MPWQHLHRPPYTAVTTCGSDYHYEYGDGAQTVVFVHGFQASGRIWQLVCERMPRDRYRMIAVDNRGAGQTDAPLAEDAYGVKPFADDLDELMTALGLRDVVLVGHSMGGATAMQFAVEHPALVRALVLVDPAGPDGIDASVTDVDAAVEARLGRRGMPDVETIAAGFGPEAPAEFARALAADMAAAPEQRLRGSYRSMLTLRIGDAVSRLPMPVLMLAGDSDQVVPLGNLLETFRMLPAGSSLHVWHGVGHSPNVETPDRFVRVLRRFVERTVPARLATEALSA
ncbi:MAG: alpha/beta fold hydrolase [Dehalococcoidia bacterium]